MTAKRENLLKLLITTTALAGAVGFVWCYFNHICMAGHMHHPPYPSWHHTLDVAWGSAWFGCALLSMFVKGRAWKWLAGILVFLVFYRFALGSLGGLMPLPI